MTPWIAGRNGGGTQAHGLAGCMRGWVLSGHRLRSRQARCLLALALLVCLAPVSGAVVRPAPVTAASTPRAAGTGTVMAWGSNNHGELGNGTTADSHVPVAVSNLSGVTTIAAGDYHNLALKSDGTVDGLGK